MKMSDKDWDEFHEWCTYKDMAEFVHEDGIIAVLDNLWSYVQSPADEHIITQLIKHYKDNETHILRTPHLMKEYIDGICEDTPSV